MSLVRKQELGTENMLKTTHFVWIGEPIPEVELQAIRGFVREYPECEVIIWYDSYLLLLQALSEAFYWKADKKYSGFKQDKWEECVYRQKQDFSQAAKEGIRFPHHMPVLIAKFMAKKKYKAVSRNEILWYQDYYCHLMEQLHEERIYARDIRGESFWDDGTQFNYMTEAVSTQNPEVLTEIVREKLADTYQGYYLCRKKSAERRQLCQYTELYHGMHKGELRRNRRN